MNIHCWMDTPNSQLEACKHIQMWTHTCGNAHLGLRTTQMVHSQVYKHTDVYKHTQVYRHIWINNQTQVSEQIQMDKHVQVDELTQVDEHPQVCGLNYVLATMHKSEL